jgi:hypothetical protein
MRHPVSPFGIAAFYQPTLSFAAAKSARLLRKEWGTHGVVRVRKIREGS